MLRINAYLAIALLVFVLESIVVAQESETSYELEEVIVTAEKRDASLQDVSQAVSVLSGDELDQYNVASLVDLNSLVPGLNVVKNEGTRLVLSMRGVGNEANQNAIASSAVSYHIDGMYMASPNTMQAQLLDIERLEVIRGPQGTLFGQNSTGGAINVVTRRPSFGNRVGALSIEAGNYNALRLNGMLDFPLSDNTAARISIASDAHSGFSRNITLDQDLDDNRSAAFRARLVSEPSDSLSLDLAVQLAKNDRNGPAQKGILDPTPHPRELAQDFVQDWNLEASFLSAQITYEFDGFTFKSASSIQEDSLDIVRDNDRHDLNSLPPFTILPAIYDPWFNNQKTISLELQLLSTEQLFDRIEWIAGYFYFETDIYLDIVEYIDRGFDGVFDPVTEAQVRAFAMGDYGFITDSTRTRRANSLFFEGLYNIDSQLRFTSGLRYSQDGVDSLISNFYGRTGIDTQSTSSKTITGRVTLERDLSASTMLYVTRARGYKPAGSNLTFGRENEIAPIVVLPTYKKEVVDTRELGWKAELLGQQLRINSALFQYSYKNLQYQATDPEVFEGGVNNVPESRITGFEIEALALLAQATELDLRLAWLNTEITSNHLSLDNVASDATTAALLAQGFALFGPEIQQARAANIVDVIGNQLAKSPRFTSTISLHHQRNFSNSGQLHASIQFNHRGAYLYRIFNNPNTDEVSAYSTVNAMIRYEPNVGKWHTTLRVINATNEHGVNARFTDVFGVGASSEELIQPRRVLLGIGLSF